jgi:hypothetical protein
VAGYLPPAPSQASRPKNEPPDGGFLDNVGAFSFAQV